MREAVAAELRELQQKLEDEYIREHGRRPRGVQGILADRIEMSQQTVSAATSQNPKVGYTLARRVADYSKTTLENLVEKHGTAEPAPPPLQADPLEVAILYHGDRVSAEAVRRVRARAAGQSKTPHEWGQELLKEQAAILQEPEVLAFAAPNVAAHASSTNNGPGSSVKRRR